MTAGTPDPFLVPPHIELLDTAIVDAALNPGRRYVFELPPRHGKSEIGSHYGPAWFLGMFPRRRVILASYEADFAASWGRKARDVLEDHGPEMFGVRLRQDSHAANRWDVEEFRGGRWRRASGGMVTAGVGGPATGKGAHLLLIDDPFKNDKEAMSLTRRNDIWNWYLSTARTRLEPGASIVVIMTRWHQDDLVGRLEEQDRSGEGEGWTIIRVPAIAEEPDPEHGIEPDPIGRQPGEALWPFRYPIEALEQTRRALGSFWWNALYQQRPQPPEGLGKFRREWFVNYADHVPAKPGLRWVRRWDLAATEATPGKDPDWTAGALLATDGETTWLADMTRFRESPGRTDALILQKAEEDRATLGNAYKVRMEQEPGATGKRDAARWKKLLHGFDFKAILSTGSKELRANPLASAAEGGTLLVVRGPWNKPFIDEAVDFPNGDHDDQVDAASGAFEDLHASTGKRKVRVIV